MNKQKSSRRRVCECGQKFKVTVRFGNEKKCDACYAAASAEFLDWFGSLPDDEQIETLNFARQAAISMGVVLPPTEEEEDARIDAIARELLEGVNL